MSQPQPLYLQHCHSLLNVYIFVEGNVHFSDRYKRQFMENGGKMTIMVKTPANSHTVSYLYKLNHSLDNFISLLQVWMITFLTLSSSSWRFS